MSIHKYNDGLRLVYQDNYFGREKYYFKEIDSSFVIIGYWDSEDEPEPDWWEEAEDVIGHYWYWGYAF